MSQDEKHDPDRIYKPFLRGAFSTRTNYDGSSIEQEHLDEIERSDKPGAGGIVILTKRHPYLHQLRGITTRKPKHRHPRRGGA